MVGKDEVTGSSPVSSSSRGVPLHPYHAFLLRGVIFLFPLRKHVKEITLITRRDGHLPSRLFCVKKHRHRSYTLNINRTKQGLSLHPDPLSFMVADFFIAAHGYDTLHIKNTARTPRTVLYFYLVLQICILHKALIHLTGNISALSDSPYYK